MACFLKSILLGSILVVCTSNAVAFSNFPQSARDISRQIQSPNSEAEVILDTEQLSADFLANTEPGQAIVAYLTCEDYDCAEALDTVIELGTHTILPLIRLLQYGPPEDMPKLSGLAQQTRTIIALGKMSDPRAIGSLSNFLRHQNPILRANAAVALGQINGNLEVELLIPLLEDSDHFVREATATALEYLGSPQALPALQSALEMEKQTHVRQAMQQAIETLTVIKEEKKKLNNKQHLYYKNLNYR